MPGIDLAVVRADQNLEISIAINIAMMAITTNNYIKVNPLGLFTMVILSYW